MTDPQTLLIAVGCIASLIILATAIAVIRILRQPDTGSVSPVTTPASTMELPDTPSTATAETIPAVATEDVEQYLAEQRANLQPFELKDISNSFKGTTQNNQRTGIVLDINNSDKGLVAFSSQAFNPQNGVVTAETAYGKMELIITQGRAGVKWEGQPLGILDYRNQRILGPEGQLLGNMERPLEGDLSDYYPIGFVGQPAGEVITEINALTMLRWFGDDGGNQRSGFQNLADDLEDNQTLLMLAALLLEMGFMDLQR